MMCFNLRVRNNIGCVSEATYVINSIPIIRENIYEEACNLYVHRGTYLTQTGIYVDTFTSRITGCDSLYILNLTIDNPTVYTPSIIACGAYDLNGQIITLSGNYSSTFTDVNGCDSIVNVNLTIIDRIIPQIYSIGDTLYATSNVPDALYQWRNCTTGQIIAGANRSSFHPQEFGTYNVLVAEGTCNGTSVCAVYGNMGIEILDNMDLIVSPNPTTGMVTISYDSEEQMNATIIDASGKEIGITSIYSGSKIDLSTFVTGIYLIKIESSTSNQMVRIIKQ